MAQADICPSVLEIQTSKNDVALDLHLGLSVDLTSKKIRFPRDHKKASMSDVGL